MPPGGRSAIRFPWLLVSLFAACWIGFGLVAADVVAGGLLARADPHVAHWSFTTVPQGVHTLLAWLTWIGASPVLAVIVAVASLWLLRGRRPVDALLLALAGAVTGLVTTGLKEAFKRVRPDYLDPGQVPHSFSFPSGHASGAFAVYVLLALLVSEGMSGRARAWLLAAALALAAFVGATRVLLPVHYLTDVLAGACVGLASVAAAMLTKAVVAERR
jgi:membrane-associated phospholipid phosphatase